MRFIKVENKTEGQDYIVNALTEFLEEYPKVTWLLTGGSGIAMQPDILGHLPKNRLSRLTVMLGDERYGEFGHKDSNYVQLKEAGFDFSAVNYVPVLTSENETIEQTTNRYSESVMDTFNSSDVIIGQFGMGADGHTAGILPLSHASKPTYDLVVSYKGPDFQRITMTFEALKMIDQAYVYVFGDNKKGALTNLHAHELPLAEQPAQIFRQYIEESFIINDVIGDKE